MRRILAAFLLIAASVPAWAAQPVRARHGMVVTRERHATQAGLKVLESGGNAVDAAVAVGLALAVSAIAFLGVVALTSPAGSLAQHVPRCGGKGNAG